MARVISLDRKRRGRCRDHGLPLRRSTMRKLAPITPGSLLLEEFLKPMGISQYRLAKEIGVPPQRIGEIVAGRRANTPDTDLRRCRVFCLSDGYLLRAHGSDVNQDAQDALSKTL